MDAITQGLHHLGLTVPDLAQSSNFFVKQLGFDIVGEKPDYPARFLSDGTVMLTLWQARQPETANAFNRHNNIGLHHFALRIADADTLKKLYERLRELPGVSVEFAPEPLAGTPARHMMCRIPGGLRVEFIALPG